MDKTKTIQKFNVAMDDVQYRIANNKKNPAKCKQQRKVKQINSDLFDLTVILFQGNLCQKEW